MSNNVTTSGTFGLYFEHFESQVQSIALSTVRERIEAFEETIDDRIESVDDKLEDIDDSFEDVKEEESDFYELIEDKIQDLKSDIEDIESDSDSFAEDFARARFMREQIAGLRNKVFTSSKLDELKQKKATLEAQKAELQKFKAESSSQIGTSLEAEVHKIAEQWDNVKVMVIKARNQVKYYVVPDLAEMNHIFGKTSFTFFGQSINPLTFDSEESVRAFVPYNTNWSFNSSIISINSAFGSITIG
ncbi:MAG: hypothetical protein ACRCXZ_00420 [Patescibacteria group bacterium]